eukprot:c18685_g1_i2.p1 GENE.c18685_g1_i2~~c18685_g1_i2.p1  ORF type:complete len:207 (+),score=33.92 c18685_g1_i2:822-1442(+)
MIKLDHSCSSQVSLNLLCRSKSSFVRCVPFVFNFSIFFCCWFVLFCLRHHPSRILLQLAKQQQQPERFFWGKNVDDLMIWELNQAMEVNDEETWPISAALAVACLVEGQHPALERGCHKKILSDLVTALEAALCGWDFPRGTGGFPTDFKMMMGVQMLCKTKVNCAYLLECGVMRLIRCALDNTEASDILHRYSLLALWAIIAHQS